MPADHAATHELLARHYLVLSLAVSVGVLQIAVSASGLRGLWLVDSPQVTRWLGALIVTAAAALFVLAPLRVAGPWAAGSVEADSATREWGRAAWSELAGAYNVNDIHGGLSGADQAMWFPAGAVAALALTLAWGAFKARLWRLRASNQQRSRGGTTGPEGPNGRDGTVDADGLGGLDDRTYPSVLRRSFGVFAASWRDDLAREFDPARHRYGVPARLVSRWRRK